MKRSKHYNQDMGGIAKALRITANLSQDTCAKALGFKHRSSYHRLETGTLDWTLEHIHAFAGLIGMTPGDMLEFYMDILSHEERATPCAKSSLANSVNLFLNADINDEIEAPVFMLRSVKSCCVSFHTAWENGLIRLGEGEERATRVKLPKFTIRRSGETQPGSNDKPSFMGISSCPFCGATVHVRVSYRERTNDNERS
jgi:DNA-binding XRE family transcriptional regulator